MKNLDVNYIASTAKNAVAKESVVMSDYIVAEEGYCVVVEVLEDKLVYNQIETTHEEFVTAKKGDVVVGVLGERMALKGYSGRVPRTVSTGDILHILNMGGIVGQCESDHPDLGPALRVKILGAVMIERGGQVVHARIQDNALLPVNQLTASAPIVMISGTAMNTGKTWAASHIVEGLTSMGYAVAAGKATGASLMRDSRAMKQHGAKATATFTDAGVVSSTSKSMSSITKGLIKHLNESGPDVIVLELGDGLIGYYGVEEILQDRQIQGYVAAHIVTASDLAGAWAARQLFAERFGASICAISGPVTDNAVGVQYIEQVLGLPAINAMARDFALANHIARRLAPAHVEAQAQAREEFTHAKTAVLA
jgi:hypothetical protein